MTANDRHGSDHHNFCLRFLRLLLFSLCTLSLVWFISACKTKPATNRISELREQVYLFTSFREDSPQGLRFLYSFDGYHWTNIPGRFLIPNVGPSKLLRDPSLSRGPDGTFHLVWTIGWHGDQGFGYASSKDLVHWSGQQSIPVMTNEPTTVNVWAPELFYDDHKKQFIMVWASTIPGRYPDKLEAHDNNHRLYFTTTRDFKTFTPSRLFFEPGFSVIDGFILKDSDRYVLIHKDNARPMLNLRVAFGKSPLGPWHDVSEPFTGKFTEGPCALKIGGDWLIYSDAYREKIYRTARTRDFKTFTDITSETSFPEGHKHGTALRVPREIMEGLRRAMPSSPD
jgi:Glycosyl hydrolases family 43